jgi:hypothetical protein
MKTIKSPDYAKHALIEGYLTNRRIDIYMARGGYGRDKQQDLLARIESGKFRGLDASIRAGKVCVEAQQALNRRPVKETPKLPDLPTSAQELLALLGM